jgi:hypothetical protein
MFDDLIPQQDSGYGKAISSIESGGNYRAVGPQTGKGRALGKYQVMDFNVGPWTKEALGQEMTPVQFLSSPEAQEAVFKHKFGGYVQKYGPEGAARAWFAGEDGMNNPNARDILGTSVADYSRKFTKALGPTEASSQARQQPQQAQALSFDDLIPQKTEEQPLPEMQGPPRAPVNVVEKVLEPITSYPATYNEMNREAREQMSRGVGQLQSAASSEDIMGYPVSAGERAWEAAKGAGNIALGGVGYVASPLNAAIRTVASKPIEENFGVPHEVTDVVGGFLLPVPGANVASVRSVQAIRTPRQVTNAESVAEAGQRLAGVGTGGAVNVPRAVASDSMTAQRTGAAVSNIPIAGNPLVRASDDTIKGLGTKTSDVAAEYGSSSKMVAGEKASEGIVDWITKESKDKANKLYERVDSLIDETRIVPPKFTKQAIHNMTSEEVKNLPRDKSLQTIIDVFQANPRGLSYSDLKQVRTYVGEMIERGIIPEGMSQGTLKRLYSGLTKDLENTVKVAGGPQASAAFDRANRYYDLISDRRASLAKIVGKDGSAPAEQVFDRLVSMAGTGSRADMQRLIQARKSMGAENWNEVASGLIATMGRTEDAAGNIIFSPQKFLTAYQDKLSPAGRSVMFRSTGKGDIANYLDDIATISARFRQLQRFANPSGTGQTVAGTAGLAGLWAEPMTAIGTAFGANLIARVLANPATVAPAAQWVRKYEIALRKPGPASVAQLTIASRNLANSVNAEFGTAIGWQELLKATQGPMRSAADNEQPEPERVINQ